MAFSIGIGQLVASIGANLSPLKDGLKQTNLALRQADAAMMKSFKKTGKQLQSTGRMMNMYLTLPMVAVGAGAFKMSSDFEFAMTQIIGLVGIAREQVDAWGKDIMKMAPEIGKAPKELAEALYFITSAGIRGAEAMEVLEMSAKASATGLGETKVVADLVTSAINAYGKENISAAEATDILVAAVREGKAEASGFAGAMGQVLPIASAMGVEFQEVAAAIAAMTRTGTGVETASMQLKNILNVILKGGTDEAIEALTQMGTSFEELRATIKNKGVLQALLDVDQMMKQNDETIASKVFPNIRALTGVLDLLGKNIDSNVEIFGALENSTGSLGKAWEEASKTAKHKMDKTMAQLKVTAIALGDVLKGMFVPILEGLSNLLKSVGDWFLGLSASMKKTVVVIFSILAAIGPLLTILGFLMTNILPGLVTAFVAVRGAVLATTAAMASNPITAFVGALAVGASALLLFSNRSKAATTSQNELAESIERVDMALGASVMGRFADIVGQNADGSLIFKRNIESLKNSIQGLTRGELKSLELFLNDRIPKAHRELANASNESIKNKLVEDLDDYNEALIVVQMELEKFKEAVGKPPPGGGVGGENIEKEKTQIQLLQKELDKLIVTQELKAGIELQNHNKKMKQLQDELDLLRSFSGAVPLIEPREIEESDYPTMDVEEPIELFDDDFGPEIDSYTDKLMVFEEHLKTLNTTARAVSHAIQRVFGALANSIVINLNMTNSALEAFAGQMITWALGLIAQFLAIAIASAITGGAQTGAGTGPFAVFTTPAFIAENVGIVLAAFASMIPALAEGGLAYGPTLAMVGDNINAKSDPEIVSPLSKLRGMLGEGNGSGLKIETFAVRGADIILATDYENKRQQLTRG